MAYLSSKTPTACAVAIVEQVSRFLRRVDTAAGRLANIALTALAAAERRVADAAGRLRTLRQTALKAATSRIEILAGELKGRDPVVLMRRGWSITRGADGRAIGSVAQVVPGSRLSTRFADGTVESTVTAVGTNPDKHTETPEEG